MKRLRTAQARSRRQHRSWGSRTNDVIVVYMGFLQCLMLWLVCWLVWLMVASNGVDRGCGSPPPITPSVRAM